MTVKLDAERSAWASSGRGDPGAKAHVLFDVTGYFVNGAGGATFYPIDAARVLDSADRQRPLRRLPEHRRHGLFQATGRGTIPVNAVAVTAERRS